MTAIIVAEKPSAARNMAKALGGDRGSHQGTAYEIANLRGHVYEFVDPSEMVDPSLRQKYHTWSLDNLPWDPGDLSWKRKPSKDVGSVITALKAALQRGDEIVIATDLDPTGEGDLLFWEAIEELGFNNRGKTFSRMEFTDESPASIRKAFANRRRIVSMTDEGDYRKALYRQQFDMLSMQFTRVATAMARESGKDLMLRQGRLKSAMVRLVGDQLAAYNDYVRKPFFQNRFVDENGVVYTDPDEQRFDKKTDVPARYRPSAVVEDSRTDKTTAPPKLLDLAGLSSLLVGKGIKAKSVLATYQKMYEAQVVSYPRTEDKTITPEQFKELSPLVDRIAQVVGVDPALLVHRQPRTTHVKPKGAHGANRPGPKVPSSLGELDATFGTGAGAIYEALAKNYLAMLADDYRYEQQKGHVADHPSFVGTANVPQSMGWKAVFDADAEDAVSQGAKAAKGKAATANQGDSADGEAVENAKGLGKRAEPFVFEGANKRPEHPSMKWLMKQLEKRDVGTGATRTSTYSEVTSTTTKYPLLVEKGRKLTLAEPGEMSWRLLSGTRIGDLGLTEEIYADMREIAAGRADGAQLLGKVAGWVVEDIATMQHNADAMRSAMGLSKQAVGAKESAQGVWARTGGQVTFKREWGGHRFSDDEVARLLAGETIEFSATSTSGKAYEAYGELAESTFKGRRFVGFTKLGFGRRDASGAALPPASWCSHVFTDAEIARLLAGESVEASDFIGKKGNAFGCKVYFKEAKKGEGKTIVPDFDAGLDTPPKSWCKHVFSHDESSALAQGLEVSASDFVSAKGRTFSAKVKWTDAAGDGRRKIVPAFG